MSRAATTAAALTNLRRHCRLARPRDRIPPTMAVDVEGRFEAFQGCASTVNSGRIGAQFSGMICDGSRPRGTADSC